MVTSPLEIGAGLLQGAAKSETDLTNNVLDNSTKRQVATQANNTDIAKAGISELGASQRTADEQAGANQRNQAQIDSQFVTLTPDLKKGAANATGDKSWMDIPDGHKLRADVYSSLLAAGVQSQKDMEPRTMDIEEGDQVYKAEYDPKTRKLRKLAGPGNKFSPDQRDGVKGKGTAPLNPFTLQNIIANQEKTLLEQTGGKGAKGIPQEGPIGALISKITNGKFGDLSDSEKTKLVTLQSLASRLQTNYANLNKLEEDRGLQKTDIPPDIMDVIHGVTTINDQHQAATAQPTTGALAATPAPAAPLADGTKVMVTDPQGNRFYMPKSNLQKALARGYKLAG